MGKIVSIEGCIGAGKTTLVEESDIKAFGRYMELIADLSRR